MTRGQPKEKEIDSQCAPSCQKRHPCTQAGRHHRDIRRSVTLIDEIREGIIDLEQVRVVGYVIQKVSTICIIIRGEIEMEHIELIIEFTAFALSR